MREIRGKTAIVTGAASGICLGMAKAFAGAEMNLVLCDPRPKPLELEGSGTRISVLSHSAVRTSIFDLMGTGPRTSADHSSARTRRR
jgi:NAD(P)-dependent dehydrogenase (short-subunit alcohol dehydrogenase family)